MIFQGRATPTDHGINHYGEYVVAAPGKGHPVGNGVLEVGNGFHRITGHVGRGIVGRTKVGGQHAHVLIVLVQQYMPQFIVFVIVDSRVGLVWRYEQSVLVVSNLFHTPLKGRYETIDRITDRENHVRMTIGIFLGMIGIRMLGLEFQSPDVFQAFLHGGATGSTRV